MPFNPFMQKLAQPRARIGSRHRWGRGYSWDSDDEDEVDEEQSLQTPGQRPMLRTSQAPYSPLYGGVNYTLPHPVLRSRPVPQSDNTSAPQPAPPAPQPAPPATQAAPSDNPYTTTYIEGRRFGQNERPLNQQPRVQVPKSTMQNVSRHRAQQQSVAQDQQDRLRASGDYVRQEGDYEDPKARPSTQTPQSIADNQPLQGMQRGQITVTGRDGEDKTIQSDDDIRGAIAGAGDVPVRQRPMGQQIAHARTQVPGARPGQPTLTPKEQLGAPKSASHNPYDFR